MTPIGSTSSNIRRAVEFTVHSSCCSPGALADTHDQLDGCAQPISSHDDDRRFTWRSLSNGAHSRRSVTRASHIGLEHSGDTVEAQYRADHDFAAAVEKREGTPPMRSRSSDEARVASLRSASWQSH